MDVSTVIATIAAAVAASLPGWAALWLRRKDRRQSQTASVAAHLHYLEHLGDPYLAVQVVNTGGRVLHRLKVELVKKLREPVIRGREARERKSPTVQMLEDGYRFNALDGDDELPLHPDEPRDFLMSMQTPLFRNSVWQDVPPEDVHIRISSIEGELHRIEDVMGHFKLWDDDHPLPEVKGRWPPGVTSIFGPPAEGQAEATQGSSQE